MTWLTYSKLGLIAVTCILPFGTMSCNALTQNYSTSRDLSIEEPGSEFAVPSQTFEFPSKSIQVSFVPGQASLAISRTEFEYPENVLVQNHDIELWNLDTAQLDQRIAHAILPLNQTHQANYAVSVEGEQLKLVPLTTGKTTLDLEGSIPRFSLFRISQNGQTLVGQELSLERLHATVWDMTTGHALHVFNMPWSSSFGITANCSISPNGQLIAIPRVANQVIDAIEIWNVRTNQLEQTLQIEPIKQPLGSYVNFSPDGKTLVIGWMPSQTPDDFNSIKLELWNVENGKRISNIPGTYSHNVDFIAASNALVTLSPAAGVQTWDVSTGALVRTLEGTQGRGNLSFQLSPDGKTLAWVVERHSSSNNPSQEADKAIEIIDFRTGEKLQTIRSQAGDRLFFTPDGQKFVVQRLNNDPGSKQIIEIYLTPSRHE